MITVRTATRVTVTERGRQVEHGVEVVIGGLLFWTSAADQIRAQDLVVKTVHALAVEGVASIDMPRLR